jgi:hypothetical protein
MRRDGIDPKVVGDQIHPVESFDEAIVCDENQAEQHDPEKEGSPRESERRFCERHR